MIAASALEAKNRVRAEAPVVVVVARRAKNGPAQTSDDAIRFVTMAARELGVDALNIDVDDAEQAPLLDELAVRVVPEVLVLARGVLLERTVVASPDDARAVLAQALRRRRAGGA